MNKIERIQELVSILNQHSHKYYVLDRPEITDKEYDRLYDELLNLEKETNYILSSSPTQKVQGEVIDYLQEVKHTEEMLSADKSKDINDVIKFMGNQECLISWKLDGLTLVLKYNNGKFQQAITRGGGTEGEDVSHTVRTFTNIPLTIDYSGYLETRGEGLVLLNEFERINSELIANNEEPYASARNLAAGSTRQLDATITKSRNLKFIAFGIVKCDNYIWYKSLQFEFLKSLGFEVVHYEIIDNETVGDWINLIFKPAISNLPYLTDGLIIEFDDIEYGKAQGVTGHHSKNLFAYKWNDDIYETKFRGVELNTTRTGMVSITGIFDEVNIDGVKVSRATLHNYNIFESLQLGMGDVITVYRANGVIPQIEDNLTRSGNYKIDMHCPSCGAEIEIRTQKTARFLYCIGENCQSKLLNKFTHFVSKKGFDIEGLSQQTLEKFINKGFLKEFADIFELEKYKNQIVKMEGFGQKSYKNLIDAIDNSKIIELHKFIFALGIPQIGEGGAKQLCKHFDNDIKKIMKAQYIQLIQVKDFGDVTAGSVYDYFNLPYNHNRKMVNDLLEYVNIKKEEKKVGTTNNIFSGKKIYATGTFQNWKKDEIKSLLESFGAEFASGYAKSLDFLIEGSLKSSSKVDKAKKDGIKVLTENDFLSMIG
jgi:DNA ligase (NAD+)